MAGSCEFDKLFTKSVPNILEKIFLSMDGKSFLNSMEVNKSWNYMLKSQSFKRFGKTIFGQEIWKELLQGAKLGTANRIKTIMSSGMVDINNVMDIFRGPLHHAAENGHKDVVEFLLDRGAELNQCNNRGLTPLHFAAKNGHIDVVQLLLDRGADPDSTDKIRLTSLLIGAFKGHVRVVQLLLDRGAEPNTADHIGTTALQHASKKDHKSVVQLLLNRGADPNTADYFGTTALHHASKKNNNSVVQLLLNRGADPKQGCRNHSARRRRRLENEYEYQHDFINSWFGDIHLVRRC